MSDMHLEFPELAISPPPNPSKWNIIPIHSSDRAAFKFCRRQWAWSSPTRLNLIPRADVQGIEKNLWFGTGIHYALEQFYNPVLRRDPAEAWLSWFELQWRGGLVGSEQIKQFADRNPINVSDPPDLPGLIKSVSGIYKVEGLCDILPDSHRNEEEFMGLKELGLGMMNFYKDYAAANDNFAVISLEHDFSVPVINAKGEVLYLRDYRKMPDDWEPDFEIGNEFGPLMKEVTPATTVFGNTTYDVEKQVHVRGRTDMIVQEQEFGRFGIVDHKTASRIDDDYFRHLELDEQCTSYLSFGELEARIHNLEYRQLEFITYQALLKGFPKPPTITSRGLPSLDRQAETTTAELFAKCIKENGLEPIYQVDPKMQNYYQWLLELGDKRFIQRNDTWRNHAQRKNAMIRLYYEAIDMLSNPVAYPNPSKNYSCLNCRFRTPCIQAEDGSDYMQTLSDGYMPNWDR